MIRRLQDTFTINLTQGKQALVDERDWYRLKEYKWIAAKHHSGSYYVHRTDYGSEKVTIRMHREIMGLEQHDKRQIDHINHNGLDNRRSNLRIATNRQNHENRRRKSPYGIGVQRNGHNGFMSEVRIGKERYYLGTFKTSEEAVNARIDFLRKQENV